MNSHNEMGRGFKDWGFSNGDRMGRNGHLVEIIAY